MGLPQAHHEKLDVKPVGTLELNTMFRERGCRMDMGFKGGVAALFPQRFNKIKKTATSHRTNLRLSETQLV